MFKIREALIPYLLMVAAVAGGLLWHASDMLPQLGQTLVSGQIAVGGPYTLTDQDGQPRASTDFRGKYQLIYFGYTFCPDVCPVDARNIGLGLSAVEKSDPALGAKIVPIFISVDPARDTPAVLKSFVANFHPRMVGLTGSAVAIDAVAKEYAVYYKKGELTPGGGYMVDHARATYLMDPEGKPLALLPQDQSPEAIAAEIKRWVK
jgi:protein SCO1